MSPRAVALLKRGLLRPRVFRRALLASALLAPLVYFPSVVTHIRTTVPCGRPAERCGLGDPAIATTVLGRAWARWESGKPTTVDERVFAPYANTWGLSDGYLAEAAVGWPVARLLHSAAAGYDVPYLLACVLATYGAGLLFSRLCGPSVAALLAALLYAWGPARLNNIGVLDTIWAGLAPLGLFFAFRYFDKGRFRDAVSWAAVWLVLGLGALYGLFLGSLTAGAALLAAVAPVRERRRRVLPFLLASAVSAAILVLVHRPLFSLGEEFDAKASVETMEHHAADLLSLLHEGVFTGPLRDLLDPVVPGFPEGASALFPTLSLLLALVLAARRVTAFGPSSRRRRRPERHAALWLSLAFVFFVCALGPTVRLAGRAVFPGPWRLVASLPVFDSLRGIHRWDQWFDLAIASAVALLLGRAFRRQGRVTLLVAAALVLAIDIWPRPVPAFELPPPSPFDDVLRSLPEDAVVGDYPYELGPAVRSWVEQLSHGRRVLTGIQSFSPPIHEWLQRRGKAHDVTDAIAVYRELGVTAFQARLSELSDEDRRKLLAIAGAPEAAGAIRSERRGDAVLLLFRPKAPLLVDPRRVEGLALDGGRGKVAGEAGRLVFRLGRSTTPVLIRSSSADAPGMLSLALVGVSGLDARLSPEPPKGSVVLDARTRREIARVR